MAVGIAAAIQSLAFAMNPLGGPEHGDDLATDTGVWVAVVGAVVWGLGSFMLAQQIENDDEHGTDRSAHLG